ncbi:phytanoyl-CoA dioxygenase family protein [Streptomyces daliensis]|uniref:Phytanoyl-CoA dioxygenase family protein n=1 Tax=Streptomyces daliensis TaxID=299421 RepID=A0A8T4IIR9_9ACTN|nr:phytanoyl-CoA dioxygenase family protein [Streptomyces daliensis]
MTSTSTVRTPTLAEHGYEVIPGALSPPLLERLSEAAHRAHERFRDRARDYYTPRRRMLFAIQELEPAFLEPLALATTLPAVCGALGPNIFVYHSHLDRNESLPEEFEYPFNWHRDLQGITYTLPHPLPLLSVKVSYPLTDIAGAEGGGPLVIPGSHTGPSTDRPTGPRPPGSVPVLAPAGSAILIDSRLWHTVGANRSGHIRMTLFYAYAYRWIRPIEPYDLSPERLAGLTPVQRQLLGAGDRLEGFHLPEPDEVPLRSVAESGDWSAL